ncbi:MAG TPA: MoxR family ATPase [Planctomycetota bacterium]|nr:MoxR family ATPase [Planctomycetota bacterium]
MGAVATPQQAEDDIESVRRLKAAYESIRQEISKVIVGQEQVVEQLLVSIFARGHCLLVGVPGLAKTLLINTLAQSLGMSFNRIQFTPDLMPGDITGTEVIQEDKTTGHREMRFLPGPVFANIILADEINRTPPKTQAALLEAMQEHMVTTGGQRRKLPEPFFVLATQNPIEQEGTYPLPEAQLDRFMLNIKVGYPTEEEEFEIIRRTTAPQNTALKVVIEREEIQKLQAIVRRVPVADHVIRYTMKLVRMTRINTPEAPKFINDWVSWGAGPRACQNLILGGKARAILQGRYLVTTEDIIAMAHPVLRHRIVANFTAEAEGISSDQIVDQMIKHVPTNEGAVSPGARVTA